MTASIAPRATVGAAPASARRHGKPDSQAETIQILNHVYECVHFPPMNSRDVIKQLKEDGWLLVAVKGSHHQFKHPVKPGRVTVPHPKRDLPAGTVKAIFRQAHLPHRT